MLSNINTSNNDDNVKQSNHVYKPSTSNSEKNKHVNIMPVDAANTNTANNNWSTLKNKRHHSYSSNSASEPQ